MLFDLNEEMLQKAAAELGDNAIYHAGDVADEVSVAAALEMAKEKFGTVHINVNSAGIGGAARTVGKNGPMPLQKFEHIVRVNLIGTFNVLRLCAEVMQVNDPVTADNERGVIINVASIAAFEWSDWPGRLCRIQGRHRIDDIADCSRPSEARYSS